MDPVIEFSEPAAHQLHNLIVWKESEDSQCLAVSHNSSLQVLTIDSNLRTERSRTIHLSDQSCSVLQSKVLRIECQLILVLVTERNIQFHDLRRDAVLYVFVPNDSPVSGSFAENFASGICDFRSFIIIGLSTGGLLIISRLQDGVIGFEDVVPSSRSSPVTDAAADESSHTLVSGHADGCVVVWDPDPQIRVEVQFESSDAESWPVTGIQTRNHLLVAAYASGHVRVFGILQRRLLSQVHAHVACINDLGILDQSHGSFLVATASDDSRVRIFSVHSVYPWIRHHSDHCLLNQQVVGVTFLHSSSGCKVAAIGYDGVQVSLFDVSE